MTAARAIVGKASAQVELRALETLTLTLTLTLALALTLTRSSCACWWTRCGVGASGTRVMEASSLAALESYLG